MKARITPSGFLHIERSGKMKPQVCPMNSNKQMCGDWCPHFGEPSKTGPFEVGIDGNGKRVMKSKSTVSYLTICNGTEICAEIIDERPIREEA